MLSLCIFTDSSATALLGDYSSRVRNVRVTTNEHGFAVLSCFVPMTLAESFQVYDRPGLPHVVLSSSGATVWEGRLEDVAIVNGGVRLQAFGYQRAMSDVTYTALWSTTSYADWFVMDNRMVTGTNKDQFSTDNNQRIYITPNVNSTQGSATPAKIGRWGYVTPHQGARNITAVSFTYNFFAPSNWRGIMQSWGSPYYPIGGSTWSGNTAEMTLNGSGVLQTGSTAITLGGTGVGLEFRLDYNAADATYGSPTGTDYLKITNLRLKTTTSASVYADEIVNALTAYVNAFNSDQISTSTALVQSPGVDLNNEIYEDETPADILTRLSEIGDNQSPPRVWEWGVWENRTLHFRPRGDAARAWYVDASNLEVERSLDELTNRAYAIYQDENGSTLRTAVTADSSSISRYGIQRRGAVRSNTTSSTQAGVSRDALLNDKKEIRPRSAIVFDRLFDASGGMWPLWMCRSGDTITIRNLPPSLSSDIDRIRTFRVAETEYDATDNVLTVTPETPIPSLQTLEAQTNARRVQ